MRRLSLIVSLFVIFILSCTKTEEKPDIIIDIQVSKNGYRPNVIEVPKGKVVLFRITSVDEGIGEDKSQKYYGHCFYIMPPYDVMVENIGKGETKEVKVKMIFPGHHIFTCPYCSSFFPTKGDIYVK
ncbi:MAG: cupredoxin domain-containing protein [Hydrogenothermaceae bacterium]